MTIAAETQALAHDLDEQTMREMYRSMLLARALDERMWLLNRSGKAPFVISCQGHEAAQVGAAFALQRGKDFTLPYYRGLGTVLVMGMTPRDVMLAIFARAADPASGGRQMPAHYGHRQHKIITQSSPVGTQIAHAAGVGLAEKIKGGDRLWRPVRFSTRTITRRPSAGRFSASFSTVTLSSGLKSAGTTGTRRLEGSSSTQAHKPAIARI